MIQPPALFPAVLSELLLVATDQRAVRVASALHHADVDLRSFLALAIRAILEQAAQQGIPPQSVIDEVTRAT